MRLVIQRAKEASVEIEGRIVGAIPDGLVVLVGIAHQDTEQDADYLVRKLLALRIFEDSERKMNLSVKDVGGGILSISQFTLYADTRKGNRPGFTRAAPPQIAAPLYDYFNRRLRMEGVEVHTGKFGADMKVKFINDGPVTICMDSCDR